VGNVPSEMRGEGSFYTPSLNITVGMSETRLVRTESF
jgi:hypothetical protein